MPQSLLSLLGSILRNRSYRKLPKEIPVDDLDKSYQKAYNFLRKSRGNKVIGLSKDPSKSSLWLRWRK